MMAKRTVLVCDHPGTSRACSNPASTYSLWRDGQMEAHSLDLCDTHAKAFQVFFERGTAVPLPSKPRNVMKTTSLRPTRATKSLKRK